MDERIIRMKLEQLRQKSVTAAWPIDPWQARSADHLAPGSYRYDGDWRPISGETEWPAGKTLLIRAVASPPEAAPAGALYLQFDAHGLEGLLTVDGRPYAGIDPNHLRAPIAGRGGSLRLEAEFMCLAGVLHTPELRREKARLRQVSFVQVDPVLEAACFDLWFAWEASLHAPDVRRRQRLHDALEAALLAIDLTAPPGQLRADAAAARALLQQRLAAIAPDPEAGKVFLTGHSHIDTAWLWPLRETVRKCGRTFSTACRLLEQYPDYHFSCSQPQLYAYTRQYYPALYQEIKAWVKAGRWECTGGMWVESDCNVPSGESLIRQILFGLRFFRDEFGARPRICWLPDVFGYPAALPQILKGCGLDYFYTNKLHWQARNPFPAHLFWWQGIDGSQVLAHIPRLRSYYNGWPNPQELSMAWDNFSQKAVYEEVMLPFGFGDGGGGPTPDMLEFAARAAHYPGLPAARLGLPEAYFDDARRAAPDLPTWVGELYLETHRGTYTTQSAIKRANRQNELLLREAEIWGVLAGPGIDLAPLDAAWETLLLLQFHDILPGSSIGEVYREAAGSHAGIGALARQVRGQALAALAAGAGSPDLAVFNSLSWPRDDIAAARVGPVSGAALEAELPGGRTAPVQVIGQGADYADIVFNPGPVPAMGCAAARLRPAAAAPQSSPRAGPRELENRFFRIELDDGGQITRLLDKRCGRDVIPPGQCANRLQLLQDGPEREAAWNVHDTSDKREYAWDGPASLEAVEHGPVRAAVRVAKQYRDSRVEQDIIVYEDMPRIDFVTRVDWQARQTMLKAAFPVDVLSPQATYEIQFGAVERPTHRNTSWEQAKFEVCAHRWADLSEPGYGVSLLNDGKYGYDVKGNVLRLTLLRGAEWPDPDADRGRHEFTYSLLPHPGDWREAQTARRGWELNVPLVCVTGAGGPGTAALPAPLPAPRSWIGVEGPVVLETLKPAGDGQGWIVRLYEPNGGRGRARVTLPGTLARLTETNLVEEPIGERPHADTGFEFNFRPFEIKTFRVELAAR